MSGYAFQLQQARSIRLTSNLRQAIEVMNFSNPQFADFLEFRARTNPFLELRELRSRDRGLPAGTGRAGSRSVSRGGEGFPAEGVAQPPAGLIGHVRAQIPPSLRDAGEVRIAEHLLEALEPTGWLGRSTAEIARDAACPVDEVEAVLRKMQRMEPAGLFARSLAECLRLQAVDSEVLDPVMEVVLGNLDLVAAGRLGDVARICEATTEEVAERLRVIRGFNPKPGAGFCDPATPTMVPDLSVVRRGDEWIVDVRNPAVDAVAVRPVRGVSGTGGLSAAERELLQEARSIQRAAERRDITMVKVAAEIVRRQEPFLLKGPSALRPMRLVDIAAELRVHESTVSRITSNRCIETPRGVIPLREFFSRSLGETLGGDDVSASAVRDRILSIIAAEDCSAPVSDQEIVVTLAEFGYHVARRTVAKYREQIGIGNSVSRKRAAELKKALKRR